jgi:iron complex outermembrane recepter protein
LAVVFLYAWTRLLCAQDDSSGKLYELDIAGGTLLAAIKQFSEQTEIQVTVDSDATEVDTHHVDGFRARLPAREALRIILAGSALSAEWRSERTVRIYHGIIAPRAYGNQREVIVTGSRIDSSGDEPAPVRVYSRADIDRSGVSGLPGLAGYFTQQPFSFGEWAQRSGAQHFQMRGLGVDTTLVLINGRRAPPSATSVTLNAFDLNTIPLTAVDRIEIMSDSASAIYGADAIGGVVNIILREDIKSPDVYLHYGDAAGGARERRAATSFSISGGRFKSAWTIDYFERDMLIGAERDLWRNQNFTRFGGTDWRVATANPGNIYSITGESLPGLRSSQASVPVGSSGIGLRPEDFLATDGVISRDSSLATAAILPALNRLSAFGSGEFSLNDGLDLFGEVLIATSEVGNHGALPFVSQVIVPAENPFNPFGQPVAVDYRFVGMKPTLYSTESEFTRFVFGARGGLHRWDWEVTLTSTDEHVNSARTNDVDITRVQSALESTEPQSALNLFADGPAGTEALLSSLVGKPQVSDYFSGGVQASGFLRGQLFEGSGGTSELVIGGEWRREELRSVDMTVMDSERDIASGFAEVKLPLLKALSIKLALRGDYYENANDAVNPQYGLVWRLAQDWMVRAAYGTSFRPPSLPEQGSQTFEYLLPIADPSRGGSVSLVRLIVGGNPDLENVSAHSFTSGIVWRPNYRPGLQLGAHYWRVVMDDRIVVPRTWDVEKLEQLGRVTRFNPTEDDSLAGWPGMIESLDGSLLNYGRLETSGIDVDLSYRVAGRMGSLQTTLSATWVDEYASQDLSPLQGSDRVGIATLDGTIPEWRLVGSVGWEGKAWGASTTATFTPSYRDADLTGVLNRSLPSRTIVDIQTWLDLGKLFESEVLEGLKLTAGALNLLDEDVDFANVGLGLGFDVSQADLKQRFAYMRITKSF